MGSTGVTLSTVQQATTSNSNNVTNSSSQDGNQAQAPVRRRYGDHYRLWLAGPTNADTVRFAPTNAIASPSTDPLAQTQVVNATPPGSIQSSSHGNDAQMAAGGGVSSQAQGAPLTASTASSSTNTPSTSLSNGSSATQQQLAQLEAMLQQLGIDPQSLSGPALTALMADAADPAALLAYAQQLQGTSPPAPPQNTHVKVTI